MRGDARPVCYHLPRVETTTNWPDGLALIFDMDGVLVDSTALHTAAWERYLARLGVDGNGLMQRMLGKRNDQIVRDLFGASLSAEEAARHGADKEALYRELMAPVFERCVVPGVAEFVHQAARAGMPLGLGTNAEPLNVEFVLHRAGLEGRFQAIVDGHQVSRPKPDPEVYLEAARRLGVEPRNCVVFEDSPGGMAAARAAGARLVGVLTTLEAAPEAALAICDFHDERLRPWLAAQRPA
jgi:beta-phosphoglucomutase